MFPKFNLIHLKYFYDAVRLKSVSASAKINHVGQSTVSQACSRLEGDLGIRLTHHQKNRFQLTNEGEKLFQHAAVILRDIETMQLELTNERNELVGPLAFATVNSLATSVIPQAYRRLLDEHPKLKIRFHRGSRRFIKQALLERSVELGIVLESPTFSSFDRHPLFEGSFGVFGPPNSTVEDLKKGIIVDDAASAEVTLFCQMCKNKLGFEPPILHELSSWSLVERFVAQEVGIGLFPSFLSSHVNPLELPFSLPTYKVCAIFLKGETPSDASMTLLECIKKQR